MMFFQNWGDALTMSLGTVWYGVVTFVPTLILALVVFAIGWVLAVLLEKLVETVFKSLKVDAALKSAGFEDVIKRSGHNLNSGLFVGAMIKWFVIVVFLMASFDTLRLTQVTRFLGDVVNYLPSVIIAVLILMVGVIVANAMQRIVVASSRTANIKSAELLGRITKWAIWIFALLTAFFNLGIDTTVIQTVITAVFAGGALAIGLAFGLGGKEVAQRILERVVKID